jgi:hypothetical protein
MATEEICQCWDDELAAVPAFLLHLDLFILLLVTGDWQVEIRRPPVSKLAVLQRKNKLISFWSWLLKNFKGPLKIQGCA